jgi:hypothetical protein
MICRRWSLGRLQRAASKGLENRTWLLEVEMGLSGNLEVLMGGGVATCWSHSFSLRTDQTARERRVVEIAIEPPLAPYGSPDVPGRQFAIFIFHIQLSTITVLYSTYSTTTVPHQMVGAQPSPARIGSSLEG